MKKGLDNCPNTKNSEKAELAFNLAKAYHTSVNTADFKTWGAKAKEWSDPNTPLYKYLVSIGF